MVWAFAVLLSLPPFFGWNRYQLGMQNASNPTSRWQPTLTASSYPYPYDTRRDGPPPISEGALTSCSFDYLSCDIATRSFVLTLLAGAFVLPMLVIVVCYSNILNELRKRRWQFPIYSTDDHLQRNIHRTEFLATRNAALIVLFFCLAWSPYAIIVLVAQFGNASIVSPVTASLPAMFAKTAAIYNPLVYAISIPTFAARLAAFMRRRQNDNHDNVPSQSAKSPVDTRSVNIQLLSLDSPRPLTPSLPAGDDQQGDSAI